MLVQDVKFSIIVYPFIPCTVASKCTYVYEQLHSVRSSFLFVQGGCMLSGPWTIISVHPGNYNIWYQQEKSVTYLLT
jgi:hypothetical protein